MSGARLRSYRLGDRSELLVEHLLAGFAFTTRVPRQEDIGIDFLCSLITGEEGDGLLKAGPFFAVQAKRSAEGLVYEKPHELEWIANQENPFLLCVADREAAAMDVYSTWNLVCGVLGGWEGKGRPHRITLQPEASGNWPGVKNNPDYSQDILLGKPIIRVTHNDLVDQARTKEIAEVIGSWVALDRANIINRHAGMYWVVGPLSYETGRAPYAQGAGGIVFYWHPNNLEKCSANLGRVVTAIQLIYRNFLPESDKTLEPWPERIETLSGVLRSHWALFDEPVKRFLAQMKLDPTDL